jgi:hypothetical protein
VLANGKAAIGRPPEDVLAILWPLQILITSPQILSPEWANSVYI